MHVLFYDENFKYAGEDDIELNIEEGEELPPNCTTALIPAGLYDPKYDPEKDKWFESATKEYIESVTPPAPEPNPTDLLKKQNALLSLQIAKLQADVSALKGGGAS
ncbi:hypothetical protein P9D51_22860 [Bacillus sonorensis]|uniref:hypothetical protein n=1 Tax=Bacillus TaxID=1386 RepID=UPI00227EE7E8|nr:hypothetical protein [Bacillus sonorensis]MCY7858642.1 hypothetical protein [Bacillus sonorensis]MCY8025654.1 hypothetical protein [Bacillus sonorensis]MCY8087594.1 hypothetical protein [Bacillus sonorensis]MCY8271456.1 hypothetical protein [Bacillus sonorensis]MCY8562220.1 hypothetical protein [Bacillus sonorensis]